MTSRSLTRLLPLFAGVLFVLTVIFPDVAHACPVCFDSREENRVAFIATTAFLTFLPLGLIGAMVFTLFRLHAKAKSEQDEARPAADSFEG